MRLDQTGSPRDPIQQNEAGRKGLAPAAAFKAVAAALIVSGSLVVLTGPSPAQLTQSRDSDDSDRRICRYTQITGKLSKSRRVCMTRAEWERTAEDQRKEASKWVHAQDSCAKRAEGGSCF